MAVDGKEILAQLGSLNDEQLQLAQRRDALSAERVELEQDRTRVEREAANLEERIRELAKEEAEVQRRKRAIQEEAKEIGRQRRLVMERTAELSGQEGEVAKASARLAEQRAGLETLLERAQLEEAQRAAAARVQAAAPPPPQAPEPAPARAPETHGAEKRTSKRIPVAVDVSMQTPHNFYMGLTENLSEGGLFVATYDDLPLGTEVELQINLPNSPGIKTRGIVRWIRGFSEFTEDAVPGVGLQMVDLSEADQQAIRSFLAQRDPIYYESLE